MQDWQRIKEEKQKADLDAEVSVAWLLSYPHYMNLKRVTVLFFLYIRSHKELLKKKLVSTIKMNSWSNTCKCLFYKLFAPLVTTELQRELKRKQYAQKAKNKLDAYHAKVKTEAEKIQELKNLGIDPNSLF